MKCMAESTRSENAANHRRADARRTLAQIPWPTEAERIKEQVRRDSALNSEERFRAQLSLLSLVGSDPEAVAAARRWHDRQDAVERERFLDAVERYETRHRRV